MELAAAAMSSLIPKLSALLAEEVKLSRAAKRDVKFLKEKFEDIRGSILAHTGEEPVPEHQVLLLRDVRELSYDIEDSLDGFMLRMQLEPGMKLRRYEGFIDKCKDLLTKVKMRRKIAISIQDIKSRVAELSNQRDRYGVVTQPNTTVVDPRLMAMFRDASALVGVEDPLDELSKLLLMKKEEEPESAAQLKVISIVGSGGLGKTTLANEIYLKTRAYFDFGAWISVSPKPNLKKILIHILSRYEGPHISGQEDELVLMDVVQKITKFLQDKRYLIVMDDVWSSDVCDFIRCALPMNNLGSRIIVTTRINSVAESCCSHWNDHIYNIKPLSMKDSRLLFHRRIFGPDNEFPPALEEVSDKILNKCSGVPLAIITMSALLASRPLEKPKWEEVCNSIGATSIETEGMKSIFFLSYYNLPQHLKVCFLYLSIFPQDYPINRSRVLRSWIAEGFILSKPGETAEEVGENYLNELINRQMIHPVHGNYDGKPETYLIHGMMLDLIKSKSIEENFVTILDNRKHVPLLHDKIRRLSLINIDQNHYPDLENSSHVRTLSIFGSVGPNFSFKYFTFLRVLDLEGCTDLTDHNVKEIPRLIHLRHLNLRHTNITELPEQIGRLQLLRTLDLCGTEVRELPTSIVQLPMLAHLLCDKMRFPKGIGKMTALSCLSQFDILQSNILAVKELGNLSELRELVLWWFPHMESNDIERYRYLATSLYRLDKLQSLYIHGRYSSVDFLDHFHHHLSQLHSIQLNRSCYLTRIPEWFISLPGLRYVSIDIKEVKSEDLQLLSELDCLLHLSVSSKVVPTEKVVISSNGFRALKEFHLHSVRADLTFEPRAMPALEFLLLSLCVLPEETYVCSISIGQFMRLKKIDIRIHGEGASAAQMLEATDVAIRKVANELPNRPVVNIIALGNLNDYAVKKGKEKEQGKEIIEVV